MQGWGVWKSVLRKRAVTEEMLTLVLKDERKILTMMEKYFIYFEKLMLSLSQP